MTGSYIPMSLCTINCFIIAPKPSFDLDWVSLLSFSHLLQSYPEAYTYTHTQIHTNAIRLCRASINETIHCI